MLRQVLGHGSDSRSYFQHAVIPGNPCGTYDFVQHVGIYEKILTKFLLECKLIFLYDFNGIFRITQSRHVL